jgi:hypothetical protein
MEVLDKGVGYDEVCLLVATEGSTEHEPAGQCWKKSFSRLEGLWN